MTNNLDTFKPIQTHLHKIRNIQTHSNEIKRIDRHWSDLFKALTHKAKHTNTHNVETRSNKHSIPFKHIQTHFN